MLAARGRLIGFVDDDCFVAPNWIAEAVQFAVEHPQAGAFGGQNELSWQREPPEFVSAYGESLARQDWGDTERQLPSTGKQVPCGAGLVLRRDALLQSHWLEQGRLRGRDPRYLGAGEDTEILLQIRNAGWEIWYAPRLKLRHVIPPERMTLNYLRRLHRGFGRAEVYLRNIALQHDRSLPARCSGLWWACGQMVAVWRRFWLGYVRYVNERPSWLIRLSYATGCVEGALRFLLFGTAK
jgi:GT2 family glycosyltransferase